MAEPNRSLSACLRCRRQKMKCAGPDQIPCQRCKATNSECVFVLPKSSRVSALRTNVETDKIAVLEKRIDQRLDRMEERHRTEIQSLKSFISQIVPGISLNPEATAALASCDTNSTSQRQEHSQVDEKSVDIVARGLTTDSEWQELYRFFYLKCRGIISFVDENILPPMNMVRSYPHLSLVVCLIASRVVRPEKYQVFLVAVDEAITHTFSGPTPHIQTVWALIILSALTGRSRLWGYIASLAAELGLHTAALQLNDNTVQVTADIMERARTWFSLCCFDLVSNLNRPYVINKMADYLPSLEKLASTPFSRPVDHRIMTYFKGFWITADAKAQLPKSQVQVQPMPREAADLLTHFDQRVDRWFYESNNAMQPLYQRFGETENRNRYLIPYLFMKIFLNGFALYGITLSDNSPDYRRISFIQRALDSAVTLLRTQYESEIFRKKLRYAMDYNGTTTYYSVNFILRALTTLHQCLNHHAAFPALLQAAQMFEESGATDTAKEVRREAERLATVTQTELPFPDVDNIAPSLEIEDSTFFDIPTFLDEVSFDAPFPSFSRYRLE